MRWVVFLRAVNVGKANRCQPAQIAKELAKFGFVNLGAVGTFVVREDVSESVLRKPSDDDWVLKVIAIQDRFVLGLYRRQMKAISYLGKIEKLLGVPVTTRNWNTIEKVVRILEENR